MSSYPVPVSPAVPASQKCFRRFEWRTFSAYLLICFSLLTFAGCESIQRKAVAPGSDFELLQEAIDTYLAYEQNDCDTVFWATRLTDLKFWEASELRDSMYLVRGFCKESRGKLQDAKKAYQTLLSTSTTSPSALDAKERMRHIQTKETNPNHDKKIQEARLRALSASAQREPVDRPIAIFPPVPHAAGIEGYALVEFGVTPRGDTSGPIVIESSPPLVFDGAAVRAVRSWLYADKSGATGLDRQVIRLTFVPGDESAEAPLPPEAN